MSAASGGSHAVKEVHGDNVGGNSEPQDSIVIRNNSNLFSFSVRKDK